RAPVAEGIRARSRAPRESHGRARVSEWVSVNSWPVRDIDGSRCRRARGTDRTARARLAEVFAAALKVDARGDPRDCDAAGRVVHRRAVAPALPLCARGRVDPGEGPSRAPTFPYLVPWPMVIRR